VVTSAKINIFGVKLIEKTEARSPQYEMTGLPPVVWIFNKLTGATKYSIV
jgi:hypothetical protein